MRSFRSVLSLILILIVLCSSITVCASAPQAPDDTVMDQILGKLSEITEQTRCMSDEELAEQIQLLAEEYHAKLNAEQLDFLISACRGLERMDGAGETIQEYGEKASRFRETLENIFLAMQRLLNALSGFFASLNKLADQIF